MPSARVVAFYARALVVVMYVQTKIVQCICGWGDPHNAEKILGEPAYAGSGVYGFAEPDAATTLPQDDEFANAQNIAAMRWAFNAR